MRPTVTGEPRPTEAHRIRDRWEHARGWRCPCIECTVDRIVDRIAVGVGVFALIYFGAHVVVAFLVPK